MAFFSVALPALHSVLSAHVLLGTARSLVIASAPWAARFGHTSVIDVAGAICVLGGRDSTNAYLNDVLGQHRPRCARPRVCVRANGVTGVLCVCMRV